MMTVLLSADAPYPTMQAPVVAPTFMVPQALVVPTSPPVCAATAGHSCYPQQVSPSNSTGRGSLDGTYAHNPYDWGLQEEVVFYPASSNSSNDGRHEEEVEEVEEEEEEEEQEVRYYTVRKTHPAQRIGSWIRGHSITNVVAGGPSEAAGLEVGMRIIEVEGVATEPAAVSSTMRKLWKERGTITVAVLPQPLPSSRSKRSLAKARARQRSRLAKKQAKSMGSPQLPSPPHGRGRPYHHHGRKGSEAAAPQ